MMYGAKTAQFTGASFHCFYREMFAALQSLLAGVGEVMPDRRWNDEHAAGTDRVLAAVFQPQLAAAGKDVLRLLGRVGVPAEPAARLDLVDDRR